MSARYVVVFFLFFFGGSTSSAPVTFCTLLICLVFESLWTFSVVWQLLIVFTLSGKVSSMSAGCLHPRKLKSEVV